MHLANQWNLLGWLGRLMPRSGGLVGFVVVALLAVALGAAISVRSSAEQTLSDAPSSAPVESTLTATGEASRSATTALQQAGPRDWFVSPSGSNGAAGTRQAPFASVSHAASLAKPGDTIVLMAGAHGVAVLDGVRGTASDPIRVIGENGASVSSGSIGSLAAFLVKNSSHVEVSRVRAHTALWGFLIETSDNIDLVDVVAEDVGQEGIKIQLYSHHVLVDGATVRRTGLKTDLPYTGEGIYLGSGRNDIQDTVNHVQILNSEISFTTAEAIDIKAYVHDVVVDGNFIHDIDTFNSGAVVVGIGTRVYPDPSVVIRNNTITRVRATKSPYADANCIALSAAATVYNNILYDCADRGIFVLADFPNSNARQVNLWFNTVVSNGRLGDIVDQGVANTSIVNNIGSTLPGNVATSLDLFISPATLDFRLRSDAIAAIDTGAAVGGVDRDIVGARRPSGSAPDLGAHEFVGTATSTTVPPTVPPTTPPSSTASTAAPTTQAPAPARPSPTTTSAPSTTEVPPSAGDSPETSNKRVSAPSSTPDSTSPTSTLAAVPMAADQRPDGDSSADRREARSGSNSVAPTTVSARSEPETEPAGGSAADRPTSNPADRERAAADVPVPEDVLPEIIPARRVAAGGQEAQDLDAVPDQLAFVDAEWGGQSGGRLSSPVAAAFACIALGSVATRFHSHRRRGVTDL